MVELPDDASIPDLVRERRSQAAWRLAVRSMTEQLTYDQLVRRFQALTETLPRRHTRASTASSGPPGGPRFIVETLAALDRGDAIAPAYREAREAGLGATDRPAQWRRGISWLQRRYPLVEHDTMLHTAAAGSPEAVFQTLWPLCVGATVANVATPHPLSRLLACHRYRITVLILSEPALDELLTVQAGYHLLAPVSLRCVLCLGDSVSHGLSRRFAEWMGRHGAALCSVPWRQLRSGPADADTLVPARRLTSIG